MAARGKLDLPELSVLGADRFQRLSTEAVGQGKGCQIRQGLFQTSALAQRLSNLPATRAVKGNGAGVATPQQQQTEADLTKSGEKGLRPSGPGLSALSLRLSSSRLQHRLEGEGNAAAAARTAEEEAPEQKPISLSERCGRAFGEAMAKKAKASNPLFSRPLSGGTEAGEAVATDGVIVPVGDGHQFQRRRLAEWMELAAQHAPPVMKQQRALPGGMQDAYLRAVRSYLTACSLAARSDVPAEDAVNSEQVSAIRDPEEELVLSVVEVHPGQEGTLVTTEVAAVPTSGSYASSGTAAGLKVGATARLLLHHRHPALTVGLDARNAHDYCWPPAPGTRLIVRGFKVVAAASSGKSSGHRRAGAAMLVPLDLEVAAGAT